MTSAKLGIFSPEAGTGFWQRMAKQRRWVFSPGARRLTKAKGLTGSI